MWRRKVTESNQIESRSCPKQLFGFVAPRYIALFFVIIEDLSEIGPI
jgi:hypothetical protein